MLSEKWDYWDNSKECEKQWAWFHKNNNKNITIGSLNHCLKIDDYEGWKNITRDSVSSLINKSVGSSGSHADVANVIYHYFKDCFVCAEIKTNSWYYFNELSGGKWEETETGHILGQDFQVKLLNYMIIMVVVSEEGERNIRK